MNEYLGWFKNTKKYPAPQIIHSDICEESNVQTRHIGGSEDVCPEEQNRQGNESIDEDEFQGTTSLLENMERAVADVESVSDDKDIEDDYTTAQDTASPIDYERQQCMHPAVSDGTQPTADSCLEEQDDTLGADSDEDGSILGEEELLNIPTSAFFNVTNRTRHGCEEEYEGPTNPPESSFNFDSNSFFSHQDDESHWPIDDGPDVIIELSEDDSEDGIRTLSNVSPRTGPQALRDESAVHEELLLTRHEASAVDYYRGFRANQDESGQTGQTGQDDSDVLIEDSEEESDIVHDGLERYSNGNQQDGLEWNTNGHQQDGLEQEINGHHQDGLERNTNGHQQDGLEQKTNGHQQNGLEQNTEGHQPDGLERNTNGHQPVTNCHRTPKPPVKDDQQEVESSLIEEHGELEGTLSHCRTQEEHSDERKHLLDYSTSSLPVDDSVQNKSKTCWKNFLKKRSKPAFSKVPKPKKSVTPVSEKKKKKKKRNSSVTGDESTLNLSNPTDISHGANDSRLLPEHLTKDECEAKSSDDAGFQILFSGHCLKLEVKETNFSPKIMKELRVFYQSVCDDFRHDIIKVSDALEQGEEVESARDLLLERLNDRLMKNLRGSLEKECDRQLLREGREMSDNDYNICFLNGGYQKLDVQKVIPYRERPFKWYIRKSFLRNLFVLKLQNETNLSVVPALQELLTKTTIERKTIIADFLKEPLNSYSCLPGNLQLVLMSITYWYNNSSLRLNRCHVYVLVLCFVMFHFIDPCIGRERNPDKLKELVEVEEEKLKREKKIPLQMKNLSANQNIAYIASHLDRHSCAVAALRLADYHKVNKAVTAGKLKKHFVHSMCEFQACFNYIGALNSLLGNPFLYPSMEQVLNCTFAYNAFMDLSKSKYQGTVLGQRLGEKKQMTFLFDAIHQFVGKTLNMPMVLDLYPKVIQKVNKHGVLVTSRVSSINLGEKLKKEQERIEKENALCQVEALAKEFEAMDLRKYHQAKRKAALLHKQMSSTPVSADKGSRETSKKGRQARNKDSLNFEIGSISLK